MVFYLSMSPSFAILTKTLDKAAGKVRWPPVIDNQE